MPAGAREALAIAVHEGDGGGLRPGQARGEPGEAVHGLPLDGVVIVQVGGGLERREALGVGQGVGRIRGAKRGHTPLSAAEPDFFSLWRPPPAWPG